MNTSLDARRQFNGTFGDLWWDGEKILETVSFEAKVTVNREDVSQSGDNSMDSKMMSLKGEGTLKIKKVYSRGLNKLLEAYKSGRDPRSQFIGLLNDPDALGKERVVIDNCWFNEFTLMQFENNQLLEREFPFGFTPKNVTIKETVK